MDTKYTQSPSENKVTSVQTVFVVILLQHKKFEERLDKEEKG